MYSIYSIYSIYGAMGCDMSRERGDTMQISSRFTIAVHIFACIEAFGDQYKLTSDFLAGSVNVNPVIIRKTMSQLQKAGLIKVARGTGGIRITRPLEGHLQDAQRALEQELAKTTLADIQQETLACLAKDAAADQQG